MSEIDNKYDNVDPGDLVYDKDLDGWVNVEAQEAELKYEEELDVHHDLPKINLAD
jgi:hypothetical protein